jgi:hypothetical protein
VKETGRYNQSTRSFAMHLDFENSEWSKQNRKMNLLMDIRATNINVSELLQKEKELRR